VADRWGQLRANPAAAIERDCDATMLRCCRVLKLDLEPLRDAPGYDFAIQALSGLGVSLIVPMQSRERVFDIAYAQNPAFYQGKTIRIMVGSDSGGLYDLWARLFAKHMPKHIPEIRT
jgi:hypothetical protein